MRYFMNCIDPQTKETLPAQLPTRADSGSAGYDFYLPKDINILPGETVLVPTNVKAHMRSNEVLLLYVRSSIGIKRRCVLANGTGVIDSTYFNNPDNDGNITIALTNVGNQIQNFYKGERIMQGVFVNYLITIDDQPLSKERKGGIGSSGV